MEGKGHSTASLVLGILAIIASLTILFGALFGILAIIFGAKSLKTLGRKKAISGIVMGSIGIVLSLLMILIIMLAIPALQKSQRDSARRNDVSILASDVVSYQTNNRGQYPSADNLETSNLILVKYVTSTGKPTTDTAIYATGLYCDGTSSEQAFSITVSLESSSTYCQDL